MSIASKHLGIMTAGEFENRTKATTNVCGFRSRFKSRGSSMAKIDSALATWDTYCGTKWSVQQKLGMICGIADECRKYLNRKKLKSSALSGQRKQIVTELGKSCRRAVAYLRRKEQSLGKAAQGNGVPTTSLALGYHHERAQYQAAGRQQNPWSASAMDEEGFDIKSMTGGEYLNVGRDAKIADPDMIPPVEFLGREDRLKHLVTVENGVFRQDEKKYDNEKGKAVVFAWTDTETCSQNRIPRRAIRN